MLTEKNYGCIIILRNVFDKDKVIFQKIYEFDCIKIFGRII